MLDKIDEIEEMKMDYNSYSHLNQIKSYINKKGENILIEDINRVKGEIDKMIEILNEKEKLKKALENCKMKINQKNQMINNIYKIEEISNENMANIIKDEIEGIQKGKNDKETKDEKLDNNDNKKKLETNNENKKNAEEVAEVEEEYYYDNDKENNNQNK